MLNHALNRALTTPKAMPSRYCVSRPNINSRAPITTAPSTTSYMRMRRLNQNGSSNAVNMVLVARQAAPMLAVLTLMLP